MTFFFPSPAQIFFGRGIGDRGSNSGIYPARGQTPGDVNPDYFGDLLYPEFLYFDEKAFPRSIQVVKLCYQLNTSQTRCLIRVSDDVTLLAKQGIL